MLHERKISQQIQRAWSFHLIAIESCPFLASSVLILFVFLANGGSVELKNLNLADSANSMLPRMVSSLIMLLM